MVSEEEWERLERQEMMKMAVVVLNPDGSQEYISKYEHKIYSVLDQGFCPVCYENGSMVTLKAVNGPWEATCLECPECGHKPGAQRTDDQPGPATSSSAEE